MAASSRIDRRITPYQKPSFKSVFLCWLSRGLASSIQLRAQWLRSTDYRALRCTCTWSEPIYFIYTNWVCMYVPDNLKNGWLTEPKCTEFWSEKVQDLSYLGRIWRTLVPNLDMYRRWWFPAHHRNRLVSYIFAIRTKYIGL